MARGRKLSALRDDAYKRADCQGATKRHPPADVTRYVNQGGAALYDLMVEARGRSYFRKSPAREITTTADTSAYDLPDDFYRLISVRRRNGENLFAFAPDEEAELRRTDRSSQYPTHYELRKSTIELLPLHSPGSVIVLDYVPAYTDLVDDDDELDGVDGWEEYVVCFAARCMAVKDDEGGLVQALDRDLAMLERRIAKLAPKRDGFRPERVKDVRGGRFRMRPGWPPR